MFTAFGVDPTSYLARFSEGLRLMQQLWTQPRVDFDGRFWQLRNAAMEPKPFQKPHPPIWLGGSHPNALRRAVQLAHGFIGAGSSTTAQFAEHARILRDELRKHQRDPDTFTIAKRVYIAIGDNAHKARCSTCSRSEFDRCTSNDTNDIDDEGTSKTSRTPPVLR
jgi:alkanesulfonate monooxygenase SsuD/methylene tetrahydromethanopterin reductase-like flavin-dependent oxidoreductase (luciferase family)